MKLALLTLIEALLIAGPGVDLRAAAKLLESRDPDDRAKAVSALAAIPGRQSLSLILRALTDEDGGVRSRARRALPKREAPEDLDLLRRGVGHKDPRVRLGSLDALAVLRPQDLGEIVEKALADPDPRIREAAAGHTVNHLGGRGQQVLAAAISREREGRPRAAALLALAEVDLAAAGEIAARVAGDRCFEVRVAAVELFSRTGAHARALAALDDGDWSVRLTALRALASLRRIEAIPALISALENERGRLRVEVTDALASITGLGFAADPDRWRRWWESAKAEFEIPAVAARTRRAAEDTVATFHSIPVVSEGVAFVIDRSGSMRDKLEKHEGATKADLVARELEATLTRIEPPARFLLVAFGDEPGALTRKAAKATACMRRRALDWFAKQAPRGRTNLFDALAVALDRPDVDTIYVLTDGAPSTGSYRLRREILAEVARLNRYRKAVIHAVEIGGDTIGKRWRGFMKQLSASTGGWHVSR